MKKRRETERWVRKIAEARRDTEMWEVINRERKKRKRVNVEIEMGE